MRKKRPGNSSRILYAIDNVHFIAGIARIFAPQKEMNGPYQACIATYGREEHVETVVVCIVDAKHHLIIDHRTWLISEYGDEASRSVETAIDALTDDMIDYCKRGRVGKIFMVEKPFPLKELKAKCPHCGEENVRVPWQEQ